MSSLQELPFEVLISASLGAHNIPDGGGFLFKFVYSVGAKGQEKFLYSS